MTLDEIFRRIVRGHLWVILACLVIPLVGVAALQLRQGTLWEATVRIQVSTQDPASTTEADALSGRVLALATTPSLVRQALEKTHVTGDAAEIARKQVTSQRLGESPVVELTVTRSDPASARKLVVGLAQRVVDFMNKASYASFDAAMQQATSRLDQATSLRDQIRKQLLAATRDNVKQDLQRQLQDAQASVDQLSSAKASMELASIDHDQVVLVDGARPEVLRAPSTLVPRTALALVLGVLVGVAAAVTLETLNPRVAGTRALARLLSAPLLGNADQRLGAVTNAMTVGARRQGVETVVLLGIDDEDDRIVREMLEVLAPPKADAELERFRADIRRRQAASGTTPHDPVRASRDSDDSGPAAKAARKNAGKQPARKNAGQDAGQNAGPNAGQNGGPNGGRPPAPHNAQSGAPGPARQPDPGAEDVAEGGPSIPRRVTFTDLVGVTPAQEPTAGVVVVTGGNPRHRDVDVVEDILSAMRWPVVGIVEARAHLPRRW